MVRSASPATGASASDSRKTALFADQRTFARAALAGVERITLSTVGVSDLSPVERASSLRHLVIEGTKVSDLAPLSALRDLEELSLDDNDGLDCWTPLGALPSLRRLTLGSPASRTWLRGASTLEAIVDVRSLRDLSLFGRTSPAGLQWVRRARQLRSLFVHSGTVDARWLGELGLLKSLRLTRVGLRDISPLAQLTRLEDLWLIDAAVSDVAPLASLEKIERLLLGHNRITDILPLSGLTRLERLDVPYNRVAALPDLSALRRLHTLDIRHNRVVSLGGLERSRVLQWLFAEHNPLVDATAIAHHPRLRVALLGRSTRSKRTILATLPALVRSA